MADGAWLKVQGYFSTLKGSFAYNFKPCTLSLKPYAITEWVELRAPIPKTESLLVLNII